MNAKSGRPPSADGYHQDGLCESDYWKHRARVAETQLAGTEPFWLARGRLKARLHTWIYRDAAAEPGIALMDAQGRLRGHLTFAQALRLAKDLERLSTPPEDRINTHREEQRMTTHSTQSETATEPKRRTLYKSTSDHDLVLHRSAAGVPVTLPAGDCLPLHDEYDREDLKHLIEQGSIVGIEMEELIPDLWASK